MKKNKKREYLLELIAKYKVISIIGMDKNVGKTTVLNYMIQNINSEILLGLTSIGRDGEDTDRVTSTKKPKIYIKKGSIIATSKQCLFNGDITKEILDSTNLNTPMGKIIITRALSDGFVELCGPSINHNMVKICNKLKEYGCKSILIDGAINRKTLAAPNVSKATILSTGATLDRDINKVVEKTIQVFNNLSIKPCEDSEVLTLSNKIISKGKLGIIYGDKSIRIIDVSTALQGGKLVAEKLDDTSKYVVIKGILSDSFLRDLMSSTNDYENITLIVEDGTKIFVENDTLYKFNKRKGSVQVINPIKVLCITVNPVSPYGYEFNSDEFIERLENRIDVPVIDILGGG